MGTRALCQSLHTTMTSPPYLGHLHLRSSTLGRRGILSLQHTSAQRQLLHERLSDAVTSSERARSEPGASRPFVSSVSPISPGWPSAPPCRSRQSGPGCRQSPRNEARGIYSGDLVHPGKRIGPCPTPVRRAWNLFGSKSETMPCMLTPPVRPSTRSKKVGWSTKT